MELMLMLMILILLLSNAFEEDQEHDQDQEQENLEMSWLALQHLAATDRAGKLPIANCDFASHRDHAGPSFYFPSFKGAVVHVHQLRLRGNYSTVIGIVDDQVGIRADLDRAFARE